MPHPPPIRAVSSPWWRRSPIVLAACQSEGPPPRTIDVGA